MYSVVHYIQYDVPCRTLHIIRCTQSYTTYNTMYYVEHPRNILAIHVKYRTFIYNDVHSCTMSYIHVKYRTFIYNDVHSYIMTYIHVQCRTFTYNVVHSCTMSYIHVKYRTFIYNDVHSCTMSYIHVQCCTFMLYIHVQLSCCIERGGFSKSVYIRYLFIMF